MLAVMEKVGSYSRTLEGESTPLCYDERSFCRVCKHSHLCGIICSESQRPCSLWQNVCRLLAVLSVVSGEEELNCYASHSQSVPPHPNLDHRSTWVDYLFP